MNGEKVELLTQDEFDQQQIAARRVERRDGRVLAFFSVAGGVIQVIFLRWADVHLARGPRLGIAVPAFLVYIVVVGVLLARMERRLRSVRPRCPQCGVTLKGVSGRIAAATGNCDGCGGRILKQEH